MKKYEYTEINPHELDNMADEGWRVVSVDWHKGRMRTILMERAIEPEPEPVRDW